MTTNEARRNANRRWDRENMMTLACRVSRTDGLNFKALAVSHGTTAHQLLKGFVTDYLMGNTARNTTDSTLMTMALDSVKEVADRQGVSPDHLLYTIALEWVANYHRTHETCQ